MQPFVYLRAGSEAEAIGAVATRGQFLAGGTTLVDLMRLGIEGPEQLVDLQSLKMTDIVDLDGRLGIGALATNAEMAKHRLVVGGFPALSEAILAGASAQIRNVATMAGNLLQRTRCPYFRDATVPCNKKTPGSGCPAENGFNRSHAVLGGSPACIATHASDMAVAMVAYEATVVVKGPAGGRAIPIDDFYVVPGDRPERENVLSKGELIVRAELAKSAFNGAAYVKARDRAEYAFALASACALVETNGATIRAIRIALGGVATKPWRSREAEAELVGKEPTVDNVKKAAEVAFQNARPREHNRFKIELGKRVIERAISTAVERSRG